MHKVYYCCSVAQSCPTLYDLMGCSMPGLSVPHHLWEFAKADIKSKMNHYIDQIRSVAQSCPTLCDPMNRSMPGLPVHH